MDFRSPAPMVCETVVAAYPEWLPDHLAKALPQPIAYPAGFRPLRESPVWGLRRLELAALRLVHSGGPIRLSEFHASFKSETLKARKAVLHDLHRLGLVRIIQGVDEKTFVIEAALPVDFRELMRTSCED